MAKTLANVISSVQTRLPKWDASLSTEMNSHLEEVIRDLCRRYPYWFLKVNPGTVFATAFFPGTDATLAAATPVQGNWLGRGWLRVDSGTSTYKVWSPAVPGPDHDDDNTYWDDTPVQRIDAIYLVEPEGTSTPWEIPVYNASNSYKAGGGTQWATNAGASPRQVVWENVMEGGDPVTYLNIYPEPEDDYLLAVHYTLQYPVDYSESGSTSNSFFLNYYEVAVALGMLFSADYYSDSELQQYWTQRLYGELPTGMIEGMKRDSITMSFKDRMTLAQTNTNPHTTRQKRRSQRYNWSR